MGPARAHIGPSGPMWASLGIFPWFPAPIKVLQRVQNSHGHILSTADGKRTSVYLASARISGRNHAHAICANEQMWASARKEMKYRSQTNHDSNYKIHLHHVNQNHHEIIPQLEGQFLKWMWKSKSPTSSVHKNPGFMCSISIMDAEKPSPRNQTHPKQALQWTNRICAK